VESIDQAKEHVRPTIPPQQTIDQVPTSVDDLTRQPHEGVQKRFELHPQHAMPFLPLLLVKRTVHEV
jgi:hypothetical protein